MGTLLGRARLGYDWLLQKAVYRFASEPCEAGRDPSLLVVGNSVFRSE